MGQKDRAKDMLEEFRLLKLQRDNEGSVDVTRLDQISVREQVAIAGALMRDAGFDIRNMDEVVSFLCIVAFHLHGEFPKGSPARFPLGDFELLNATQRYAADTKLLKTKVLELVKENDSRLATIEATALKQQFDRVLTKALSGKLKLVADQKRKMPALLKDLRRLSVKKRAAKSRRS